MLPNGLSADEPKQRADRYNRRGAGTSSSEEVQVVPIVTVSGSTEAESPILPMPHSNSPVSSPQKREAAPSSRRKDRKKLAFALFDYEAKEPGQLSMRARENFIVVDETTADWWYVKRVSKNGGEGYVPSSFVSVRSMSSLGMPVVLMWLIRSGRLTGFRQRQGRTSRRQATWLMRPRNLSYSNRPHRTTFVCL